MCRIRPGYGRVVSRLGILRLMSDWLIEEYEKAGNTKKAAEERARQAVKDCVLLRRHIDGLCDWCGHALRGRERRWCTEHRYTWAENHVWNAAREATIRRDEGRCQRCGVVPQRGDYGPGSHIVEVNHKIPREGQGYGYGCHHHLDNLETLCRDCHRQETNRQRAMRREGIPFVPFECPT